jgi:type IV pilus assembly protein PilE
MKNLVSVSIASGRDVAKSRASSYPGRVTARTCRNAGFSMIELMIVVAIIAILVAIAFPSYTSYIAKSHRVAAEGCLSEYSNYMERYYTTWLNYSQDGSGNANALPAFDCASTAQTGTNYSYALPALSATAYTVEAVPIGTQASRDAKCGTLKLDQTGARYASGPSGPSVCWQH